MAASQETRMRVGSKKIYHLEAWVVKVMSLYKVSFCFGAQLSGNEVLVQFFSILCCKSTCQPLNRNLSNETHGSSACMRSPACLGPFAGHQSLVDGMSLPFWGIY